MAWEDLSQEFFDQYVARLSDPEPMPQQGNPGRLTVMERIVQRYNAGALDRGSAIQEVGERGFEDVIRRFHNLGRSKLPELSNMFYEFEFGKHIVITDALFSIQESRLGEVREELDARWSLLEGAFSISNSNYELSNELRKIYIESGSSRRDLTAMVPFLQGYQGNTCFYCSEPIISSDVQVDHVLPRQVVQHDDVWNLVLTHSFCNEHKLDRIVGEHFVTKLIARNENIMGSNHPWKHKISQTLGKTPALRATGTRLHYQNVREVLNWNYWGGTETFSPDTDPFFRRLITLLNNKQLA